MRTVTVKTRRTSKHKWTTKGLSIRNLLILKQYHFIKISDYAQRNNFMSFVTSDSSYRSLVHSSDSFVAVDESFWMKYISFNVWQQIEQLEFRQFKWHQEGSPSSCSVIYLHSKHIQCYGLIRLMFIWFSASNNWEKNTASLRTSIYERK